MKEHLVRTFVIVVTAVVGPFLLAVADGKWPSLSFAQAQSTSSCSEPSSREKDRATRPGQGSKGASQNDSDFARISFYAVPLVCPAAREIGCGGAAKPILRELEHSEAIATAWLNRAGTVIAVQWSENSTAASRAAVIAETAKNHDISMSELTGNRREAVQKEFAPAVNWYSSSGVDHLSEEEADIIAARFVLRVRATVTLSDKQAAQLREAVGTAIRNRFLGASSQSAEEGVISAGREHLDEKGVAALRRAFLQGYEALPGEK